MISQEKLRQASLENFSQLTKLKILLEPIKQMIGNQIYEVVFVADADNSPIEFIRWVNSMV